MEIPTKIMDFILSREWEIDIQFGFQYLTKMILDFSSPVKIDYSELRERNAPIILNENYVFEGSKWNIKSGNIPSGSIVKLSLVGPMIYEDQACSPGIKSMAETLYGAYQNPNIAGVVIEANSGGGESTAGSALMSAVSDKNKPVLFHAHNLASAALKAALPSNEIIGVDQNSRIGSIGTLVSIDRKMIKEYLENIDDIYSDQSPGKNSEFRQYLLGNPEPLRKMVTKSTTLFQGVVKSYRNLKGDESTIEKTLDGSIFFAEHAKQRGLIDGIGSLNYVMRRMNSHIRNQN